jgi:Arc/MetJ-type ribon-helix-helix transcriptional regulator
MSAHLSPENEAYLAELVAKQKFADRDAALDEAVALLRRQRQFLDAVSNGVTQLRAGKSHRYEHDEIDRFLADIEGRERQRYPGE